MKLRRPAVAGSFYPSERSELASAVAACYSHPLGPSHAPSARPGTSKHAAVVVPHAGYEYSGPVAAHSYLHASSLPDPDLIVIVGPNHYGVGSGVAVFGEGAWETPLGKVRIDSQAATELLEDCDIAADDSEAHRLEHSLEVQVPFLQHVYGDSVPILPICLLFQDIDTTNVLARSLARLVEDRRALLVASSDFTHYEPAAAAKRKDSVLIGDVTRMDVNSFYSTLERLQVTACGYGAIATVMEASKALGFSAAELLKYATSGDTTGDNNRVVGYGALRFV